MYESPRRPVALLLLLGTLPAAQQAVPNPDDNFGFYPDRPSYEPDQDIQIHGNWDTGTLVHYRLWRVRSTPDGTFPPPHDWEQVGATLDVTYDAPYPLPTLHGSYVDFGSSAQGTFPRLEGRRRFTLEGWVMPTLLTGADVVLAGQLDDSASPAGGAAGIGIDSDGKLFAAIETFQTTQPVVVDTPFPSLGTSLGLEDWHHVAVTYDNKVLRLYLDGQLKDTAAVQGKVRSPGLPFLLGAMSSSTGAPNKPGLFNGRLDDWRMWSGALTAGQICQQAGCGDGGGGEGGGDGPAGFLVGPDEQPVPLLYADFEDPYGETVFDKTGLDNHGTIVNHGTPGVAGRAGMGKALRLNHDQVVDAGWPSNGSIQVPGTAPSGLYVLQAEHDGQPGGTKEPVPSPERYHCVVIRPKETATPPSADVAVIVPTNTWIAYNGWPSEPFGGFTAFGIPQRGGLKAGNNSAYARLGDGRSQGHFLGWKRPNLKASPFGGSAAASYYSVLAAPSVWFAEWLDATSTTLLDETGAPAGLSYHFYSDWDLDDPGLITGDYDVWVSLAHHEYWTENEITRTSTRLAQAGRSHLNLAGNMFLWRVDLDPVRGVMENRKWPARLTLLGPADGETLIGGGARTGAWRFLYQCEAVDTMTPDPRHDYAVSTIVDTLPCDPIPTCFGPWRVRNSTHWLWGDLGGPPPTTFGVTALTGPEGQTVRALGHETDRHLTDRLPPQLGAPSVEILAEGVFPGSELAVNWDMGLLAGENPLYSLGCAGIDAIPLSFWLNVWMTTLGAEQPDHGHITYYPTSMGGHVVSIASTSAPWVLGADVPLTKLTERALRCMIYGVCQGP